MHQKITVVNIFSVSYSGSTWLNLMLGSHPQSMSGGEMKLLLTQDRANCTIHGDNCPLWSRFDIHAQENPFRQLARLSGRPYIVVNNSRKLLRFQSDSGIESRFIHLVRDGRAVLASYLRKNAELTAWSASRQIAHDIRRNLRLMRRQPASMNMLVHYEALQEDLDKELQRICAFLGLDYDPAMKDFWKPEHHFIGGNRGTLFGMLRKSDRLGEHQPAPSTTQLNWDIPYYEKVDIANFKDERWRKELTPAQLRIFALVAGRTHRKVGYGPAMKQD